jgi:hypothetical protein
MHGIVIGRVTLAPKCSAIKFQKKKVIGAKACESTIKGTKDTIKEQEALE